MSKVKSRRILRRATAILLSVVILVLQLPLGVFAIDSFDDLEDINLPSLEILSTPMLTLGVAVTVNEKTTFTFTPETSGVYCFYSSDNGESDPVARLYDADKNELAIDDDGGSEHYNFELNYYMTANTLYFIEADNYGENFSYTLNVKESDIVSIEYVSGANVEFIENDTQYGQWLTTHDGKIVDRYFQYYPYRALEDVVIRVNYKDGTSETVSYYDDNGEWTGIISDWDFYKNPWAVGSDNGLNITYKGLTVTINVTVVESPISSMELVPIKNNEYVEHDTATGYWSKYYGEIELEEKYFVYETYLMCDEIVLNVTYKDGSTEQISYIDENGNCTEQISLYSDQYLNPWTVGGNNEVEIWCKGAVITTPVTIVESPVESISLASGGDFEYTEFDINYGYYYDGMENFHYYEDRFLSDIVLNVKYKDGAVEQMAYSGNENVITYQSNQYEEPWTIGNENYITVGYKGAELTLPVTVKAGLIESLVVEDITVTEGTNGWWNEFYDNGEKWFYYDVVPNTITVNLSDGTVIEGSREYVSEQLGIDVYLECDQSYYNQWGAGTHTATVSVMGKSASFNYIIEESPIESITAQPLSFIEYTNGGWNSYDYAGVEGEYYSYNLHPETITVTYKDGTVLSGNFYDVVDQLEVEYTCWSDQAYNNPWGIGTHTAKLGILGLVAEYNVEITETPVESIAIEPISHIKGTGGWWHTHWDGDDIAREYYYYDTEPRNVTITYKDGTVITGTPADIYEQTGYYVSYHSNQGYYNQWDVGTYTVTASFIGATTEYTVEITETPVESIAIAPISHIKGTGGWWNTYCGEEDIEIQYYYYGEEPQNVTITYKDGTVITGTRDEIYEQTGYYVSYSSEQGYYNQWDIGTHTATVSFMGFTTEYTIEITETPVESIVVAPISYMVGTGGSWHYYYNEETGEEGEYYRYNEYPGEITITYKDGTVVTGTPDDIWEQTGYDVERYSSQNYNNKWDVGTHTVTMKFMGFTSEYTVEITEIPIASIVVDDVILEEYVDGSWWWHSDDLGASGDYFNYYEEPQNVTVTYNDGTVISGTPQDIYEQTGYYLECYSEQSYYNQWTAGRYTATVSFMGFEAEYNVIINESPIESVTVETLTMIEGTNCWWDSEYDWETGEEKLYLRYEIYPQTMTVTYKDGSVVTGTPSEISEITGFDDINCYTDQNYSNRWGVGTYSAYLRMGGIKVYYNVEITEIPIESITVQKEALMEGVDCWTDWYYDEETGEEGEYDYYDIAPDEVTVTYNDGTVISGTPDEIYYQTGYSVSYYSDQGYFNQWGTGTHTAHITFMGFEAEYTVEITETPISSIYIENLTYSIETNGWWNGYYDWETGEEKQYYYYQVCPDEITVYYKDGTSITGSLYDIEEQTGYDASYYSDQGEDNHWGVGIHTAYVTFMGFVAEFTVEITESPIQSLVVDKITATQGQDGYYTTYYEYEGDTRYEYVYYQYSIIPRNITVTLRDGTVITGDEYDIYEQLRIYPSYDSDQGYYNQWGVGEHTATLSLMGASCEYIIEVIESPVESVTVLPVIAVKDRDGYLESGYYDDENEMWVDTEWFYYYVEPEALIVTYKDGTVAPRSYSDFSEAYEFRLIGAEQSCYNQWDVGQYTVTLQNPGFEAEYTIDIVELVEAVDYTYAVLSDGTIAIYDYTGSTFADVVIPEKIDGYTVTVICENAFNCMNIPSVTIPDTVTYIERYAFYCCWNLATVQLGSGVKYIGQSAFECTDVKNVAYNGSPSDKGNIGIFDYNDELINAQWSFTGECTEHVYTNDCDNDCNNCSAIREVSHSYVWVVEYEADCIYDGMKHEECEKCGDIINETVIPARGYHGETELINVEESSCGRWGYSGDLYCYDCDSIAEYGDFTEPTGDHRNTDITNSYDATCGTDGNTGDIYCYDCDSIIALGEVIPATGNHVNTELLWYEEETCGRGGYTGDLYCHDCGNTIEFGEYIEPTGNHRNTGITNSYDATCGEEGNTGDIYCYDCDSILALGEVIPATGRHLNTELINAYSATCSEDGYTGDLYCNDCHNHIEYGESIPATGKHTYDNNYDEDCNICGATREVTVTKPHLSVDDTVAYQGDTIEIDVKIEDNVGFAGLQLGFVYNTDVFRLVRVENKLPKFNLTSGNSFVWDALGNYNDDGVIATLVFEIVKDAAVGEYSLDLRFMSASNEDFEAVLMTTKGATITVESAVAGDVNGDGKVDTVDLVMLRRYLASKDPVTNECDVVVKKGADANCDGVIDTIDLAFIRKYLADMTA